MINIVIPMAGAGSRFAKEGYADPKPLIKINGIPMIQVVIENLKSKIDCKFFFICQEEHVIKYGLKEKLNQYAPGSEIIKINGITEGAACTVLKAEAFINNNTPLMIANSDQYIDIKIDQYLEQMTSQDIDGLIMTMTANDPKWSFIEISPKNYVTRVVEKEVISNEATVGIYNFSKGKDFVKAAKSMIENNDRTNNEFYVAPAYNYLIKDGFKVGYYNIGSEANGMYGLGTPEDLNLFLKTPIVNRLKNYNGNNKS